MRSPPPPLAFNGCRVVGIGGVVAVGGIFVAVGSSVVVGSEVAVGGDGVLVVEIKNPSNGRLTGFFPTTNVSCSGLYGA